MAEYIEREALIEKILSISVTVMGVRSGKTLFYEALKSYREAVLKIIKKAPTADVVEVRHAKWVERKEIFSDYEGEVEAIGCSECGKSQRHYQKTNYCPNCGAKMT